MNLYLPRAEVQVRWDGRLLTAHLGFGQVPDFRGAVNALEILWVSNLAYVLLVSDLHLRWYHTI